MIARPDTPLPWINYLGSEEFFGIISNTAGGYCFYRDARLRRLTRYRYNNVPLDSDGRHLYLRDRDSGRHWSPARARDGYMCRHGLGYTIIRSSNEGVETETTYFVPQGHDAEIWRTRLTNTRAALTRLSVFSAVEFSLWDALDDATNFQRNLSIGEVEVEGSVIFHKSEYRERRDHFAYFACSEPVTSFDTQREDFLGPHGGWDRPLAVEKGSCSGSIAQGWAPIGCHQVDLELDPGETKDVVFVLGYFENPRDRKFDEAGVLNKTVVGPEIAGLLRADQVDTRMDDLKSSWSERLTRCQVTTSEAHLDRTVNIWNPYQCMATFNLSRSASLFESGVGRGMGFRDSNQDVLGFVHMIPERSRERLLDLAATQLPDGGAFHQYQPLTKRGNDAVGAGFNDDPLWLIVATAAHVKETGDLAILDEAVPFANEPGTEAPLYEHLRRSLAYTLDRLGPHGLPLIGRADWNDCLNLNAFSEEPRESFQTGPQREGGVAESVFIAGLFALAAEELAALAQRTGQGDDAESFRRARARMMDAVAEHAWDGEWFLRAYDHFGDPVGSSKNREGRIFIEPQAMCVMGGIGLEDGRATTALDSVGAHLESEHGIALVHPAFGSYDVKLGEITSYPPGYKENGGIFCHTNPWIVIAEAMLGRGERAFQHYLRINPSAREDLGEIHKCEPYVFAQMIAGPESPTHGEAKNSWLTGTAAWSYVAATQWILGIRPELEGLRIDPVIPADWKGFEMNRVFRGATYAIRVEAGRPGRVRSLWVDGDEIAGNIVPPAQQGASVSVEAKLEP